MSYEPPIDDDIALGRDDEFCDDCDCHMSEDECFAPDRMWGDDD